MRDKIAGMIGTGVNGGYSAQEHFVQMCQHSKVKLMRKPVIQIRRYDKGNFDEKGNLICQEARNDLANYLTEFVQFISKSK